MRVRSAVRPIGFAAAFLLSSACGPTLHEAVERGSVAEIQTLLGQGKGPNDVDAGGRLPLNIAAERGDLATMDLLLEHGAKPAVQDRQGQTALNLAARAGHAGAVKLLLGRGANPNLADRQGTTALMEASEAEVAALLLAGGGNVQASDHLGWTALHHAASNESRTSIVETLLRAGSDPSKVDVGGHSPLCWAMGLATGNFSMLERPGGLLVVATKEVARWPSENMRHLLRSGSPLDYAFREVWHPTWIHIFYPNLGLALRVPGLEGRSALWWSAYFFGARDWPAAVAIGKEVLAGQSAPEGKAMIVLPPGFGTSVPRRDTVVENRIVKLRPGSHTLSLDYLPAVVLRSAKGTATFSPSKEVFSVQMPIEVEAGAIYTLVYESSVNEAKSSAEGSTLSLDVTLTRLNYGK